MANSNLTLTLGFKGQGTPNAIAAYVDNGAYLLGGFPSLSDAQTPYFGAVVSGNPAGTGGELFCGIPANYVPLGVLIYEGGIAMNDPAKNSSSLGGQPATLMTFGQMWLATWGKTAPNAIDPVLGCVVICNNTTGLIEFQPMGAAAPSGWTVINAKVKAVDASTNGVMLFIMF
jgi:hypothetical protein